MTKTVVVTGGAGYVGSTLVPMLLGAGHRVRLMDQFRYGYNGIAHVIQDDNLEVIKGDIREKKIVDASVQNADFIIHLAAIVGYPACRKDPELSRSINVDGTRVIVEAAAGKIPILFASTGSTYGKLIEEFCTETTPLNPLSDYGKQKVEAEEIVKSNKEFLIYRFATAFGISPRMRMDLLPNDFAYKAVKEKTLIVYEKGFMRTFIHVRDMAQSFLFGLQNYEGMKGEIFNVGDNSNNYSKEQVARMLQKKVDFYLHFADVGHDADQRDYMVSYDKIRAKGFNCQVSMEKGLDELIKFFNVVDFPTIYSNA